MCVFDMKQRAKRAWREKNFRGKIFIAHAANSLCIHKQNSLEYQRKLAFAFSIIFSTNTQILVIMSPPRLHSALPPDEVDSVSSNIDFYSQLAWSEKSTKGTIFPPTSSSLLSHYAKIAKNHIFFIPCNFTCTHQQHIFELHREAKVFL